jgi:hypothetical protein
MVHGMELFTVPDSMAGMEFHRLSTRPAEQGFEFVLQGSRKDRT